MKNNKKDGDYMATYCIGDLHGRYDLFMLLMKKINFSCDIDHLYLLGDIIGGHKDDIKLLNFVVNNQNCISLILGNHENIILGNRRLLDIIMSSEGLHNAFLKICATYIKPFEEIEDSLFKLITPKNKQKVYTKKIQKWLSNGNVKRRKQLFDAFLELLNELEYDRNAFAQIQYIFVLFRHNIVKNIAQRQRNIVVLHGCLRVDYAHIHSRSYRMIEEHRMQRLAHIGKIAVLA